MYVRSHICTYTSYLRAWKKYNLIAGTYKKSIVQAKANFYNNDLLNIFHNKPKTFWDVINPKTARPVQLMSDDRLPLPEERSASSLNYYFSSVFPSND